MKRYNPRPQTDPRDNRHTPAAGGQHPSSPSQGTPQGTPNSTGLSHSEKLEKVAQSISNKKIISAEGVEDHTIYIEKDGTVQKTDERIVKSMNYCEI